MCGNDGTPQTEKSLAFAAFADLRSQLARDHAPARAGRVELQVLVAACGESPRPGTAARTIAGGRLPIRLGGGVRGVLRTRARHRQRGRGGGEASAAARMEAAVRVVLRAGGREVRLRHELA